MVECVREELANMEVEMDDRLVRHLANILTRDLIQDYETIPERIKDTFIYEIMRATRWGTVKMKIPDFKEGSNWRVEIRTPEMQVLPDENAAFFLFLYLLARVFNEREDFNLYIPLTKSHDNYYRSAKRGAVLKERFHFRVNPESLCPAVVEELSCQEVIFGKGNFRGLFAYIEDYVRNEFDGRPAILKLVECLRGFLHRLVTGEKLTTAAWMRRFVQDHPLYQRDSIVPKKVSDDLLQSIEDITRGRIEDPNFRPVFPDWTQKDFDELFSK